MAQPSKRIKSKPVENTTTDEQVKLLHIPEHVRSAGDVEIVHL